MTTFRYHPAAQLEIDEAAEHYEEQVEGLGLRFLDSYEAALRVISDHHFAGFVVAKDLRRITLARFPYSVIYRIEQDGLLILAVAHQAKRPCYWERRS